MSNDNVIHPINAHIGDRMREARKRLQLSQSYVGYYLNVSYQQIQKMEKGRSRISVDQLIILCPVLGVRLSYFFEGVLPEIMQDFLEAHPELPPLPEDLMAREETKQLVRNYYGVEVEEQRRSFFNMLKSCAKKTFSSVEPFQPPNPLLH